MTADVDQRSGRDPHDVLGVPRGADRSQVMRAFHRRARSGGHPDTGGDATTFAEILSARDVLLRRAETSTGTDTPPTAEPPPTSRRPSADRRASPRPPAAAPPPRYAAEPAQNGPPPRTSRLATATVVIVLLGPLFWPIAIVVGLVARHRIKRTGLGGGTRVTVALFFLCALTLPVLARVLLFLIPQ